MDFAQVIRELLNRRGWLAIGVVIALVAGLATAYRISLFPPGLEEKALSIGVADTRILVDSPASALTDLGRDFDALAKRANVYSRFMTSRPVREAIAREVGLQENQIVTEAPIQRSLPKVATEPVAAERGRDLVGENVPYRLRFATDVGLPTITIVAEAPTEEDAVRLADAAAVGFDKYVKGVQSRLDVPEARRVTIRQLGAATGGVVTEEVNRPLALLTFVGVFIGWCLLILLVSSVSRSMKELNEAEERKEDAVSNRAAS